MDPIQSFKMTGGAPIQRPRECEPLPLASTQIDSSLADLRCIAIRQELEVGDLVRQGLITVEFYEQMSGSKCL
jgi:hypothetical protein